MGRVSRARPPIPSTRSLRIDPAEERRILYYLQNSDELSVWQIAKRFDRSEGVVKRVAAKHGVSVRGRDAEA